MKLDLPKLKRACFNVAQNTMYETKHVDVTSIESVANEFFEIAKGYEEFVVGLDRDPNLITRAVNYLAYAHTMPPMRNNTRWFSDMLTVIIEMACPDVVVMEEGMPFYRDIEKGIEVARSYLDEQNTK